MLDLPRLLARLWTALDRPALAIRLAVLRLPQLPPQPGLLHRTQEMVVVFDNRSSGLSCQEGLIRANWFTRRILFDFDRIEIIRATDEDIERFAVQAGNDTDSLRRSRYPRMRCTIGPDCHLSANTIRILENSFGRVEQTTR